MRSLAYQQSVYLSAITVTNISQSFTCKMAAKTIRHRYEITSLSSYVYRKSGSLSCEQKIVENVLVELRSTNIYISCISNPVLNRRCRARG